MSAKQPAQAPPQTFTVPEEETEQPTPRPALACGTEDEFCHLFVSPGPPWHYTLCGQRLDPIMISAHDGGDGGAWTCPGGAPCCAECIAKSRQGGRWS